MASNETNKPTTENIYTSDTNANPNKMSTGAIPKVKPAALRPLPNGLNAETQIKLNNNVQESDTKTEKNGTCSELEQYMQNNVDQECVKISNKSRNHFKTTPVVVNDVCNGALSICNQLNMHQFPIGEVETEELFVNTVNRNSRTEDTIDLMLPNGIGNEAAGPSTSRGVNNIRIPQRQKYSESECSSDTGNDDLYCSDECCIYTYKGDVADLPISFRILDIPDNNDQQDQSRAGSRGSSPEMDFLEMDFDPGPSCDADSDESSINSDIKSEENPQNETCTSEEKHSPQPGTSKEPDIIDIDKIVKCEQSSSNNLSQENTTTTIKKEPEVHNVLTSEHKNVPKDVHLQVNLTDEPWIPKSASNRTFYSNILRETKGHHSGSGDLISPNENVLPSTSSSLECRINTSSSLYHSTMEKQLVLDKQSATNEEFVCSVEKTMIWSEQEAAMKQITQIGTSACGATAVLNVLLALGYPVPSNEKLLECTKTRLRQNFSPLAAYLRSRSVAGSTHKDIIRGLHKISEGQIYARFFHMYPERYINLSQWLSYWIKKGAIPVATLNLQKGVKAGNTVPDAWHHQMLFGVGPNGIYMTNPLERVEEGTLWHQLSSESVLLVKREDVVSRWNSKTNLKDLITIKDIRWHRLNVVGQVANVIREHNTLVSPQAVSRSHITIPAAYSAGITLAINTSNPSYELLKHCPELPTLNTLP